MLRLEVTTEASDQGYQESVTELYPTEGSHRKRLLVVLVLGFEAQAGLPLPKTFYVPKQRPRGCRQIMRGGDGCAQMHPLATSMRSSFNSMS